MMLLSGCQLKVCAHTGTLQSGFSLYPTNSSKDDKDNLVNGGSATGSLQRLPWAPLT